MQSYLKLIKNNREIMLLGILLTFFSSFGQTFLLSMYIPSIKESLNIGDSIIGYIYGIATFCSAVLLTYTGRFVDKIKLSRYLLIIIFGFGLSHFILAAGSHHLVLVFIAFFGLRHFGQGLMGHTSMTVMARSFSASRGKALSFSVLGHPLGEAVLPSILFLSLSFFDWRITLIMIGIFLWLIVLPVLVKLSLQIPSISEILASKSSSNDENWSQKRVLTDKRFYIIAPNVFSMSLIITAILFYQYSLAQYKN